MNLDREPVKVLSIAGGVLVAAVGAIAFLFLTFQTKADYHTLNAFVLERMGRIEAKIDLLIENSRAAREK